MMVTRVNRVESVGLTQAAVCYGEHLDDDTDDADPADSIDFSML